MTIETWQLAAFFTAGGLIGMFYFGGLWLTVKRIPNSNNPHLLLVSSFFLRMTLTLAAFYALIPWGWQALAAALFGLLLIRQTLTRIKGRKNNNQQPIITNR
ncbi:MAG TPA: ATP synthase subunit I [Pelovirga sp.]|nr:ATP synthase subunit I [Pelovirga sp.]